MPEAANRGINLTKKGRGSATKLVSPPSTPFNNRERERKSSKNC
jgi:hypothetical protein